MRIMVDGRRRIVGDDGRCFGCSHIARVIGEPRGKCCFLFLDNESEPLRVEDYNPCDPCVSAQLEPGWPRRPVPPAC